jgi:hypothetical protein
MRDTTNGAMITTWHADKFEVNKNLDAKDGIDVTGNITVTGTVDGVDIGANYANWNTAYGWGDHGAEGYLTAETNSFLGDGGDLLTAPGYNRLIYTGQISNGTSGLFSATNNANSVITLNRHSGNYDSQLGFSSNGNIYYRNFSGTAINTTQGWRQLLITDTSGNIVPPGTVDGVDIAARDAVLTSTTTTANAALPKAGGTMTGNLTINSTYPRIFLTDSNNNDDWSIINNDGKFGIYNDTDTSYALTVDGSNNVGIGTTSPAKKLDVNGDTNITGYLDLKTSSPTGSPLLRFYQSTTRRGFIQMADTNNNLRVASEYGSVSLEAAATSGVDSDTSYIRINPGGTVEIGAVDGDATISTDGNMTFRIDADNNETSQKFAFQNNASTEVASLDESGNLSLDGVIELGNASDTTIARASAGKVTIEGAPIQTTQMSMTHHNFLFNTTSTTVDYFVPFNTLTESSNPTTSNYYGRMVAPYDGRIVKAVINTTAAIGTACSAQFWVATSSGTFAPSPAETVSNINLNTANAAATATFSGTSTAEFVEGDVVGLSIQKSGTASTAYIQVTIVWEYTV